MKQKNSRKALLVLGVVTVVISVIFLLFAVFFLVVFLYVHQNPDPADPDYELAMVGLGIFAGMLLVCGMFNLFEGIFALRVAKDKGSILALWRFSIIGFLVNALVLLFNLTRDGPATGPVVGFLLNTVIFLQSTKILRQKENKP